MSSERLAGLSAVEVKNAVGMAAYARGLGYAQGGAVRSTWWDPAVNALRGRVRGQLENLYEVAVFVSIGGDGRASYLDGECSCPVGLDCKHVAAVALTAILSSSESDGSDESGLSAATETAVTAEQAPVGRARGRAVGWEASLDSLVGQEPPVLRERAGAAPLAIELSLVIPAPYSTKSRSGAGEPVVLARVMKRGKNGWIRGNLSWATLDNPYSELVGAHAQALQELYASYTSRRARSSYRHDEKTFELSAFDSRQLWPLLDQALAVGVRLVHSRKNAGDLDPYGVAEFCLDITTEESGALHVRPLTRIVGDQQDPPPDVVPVEFIGAEGHGLIWVDRSDLGPSTDLEGLRFRLAKFVKPVPAELQQLALAAQELQIPATDGPRFRAEYYPKLRQLATVVSSDESFAPPAISGPELSLQAAYGPDHALDLQWSWLYRVDGSDLRVPVGQDSGPGEIYRDLQQEREILAELDLEQEQLPESLQEFGTVRFSTELLPQLVADPQVDVEVSGEPADYREVGDSLTIEVSASAEAGQTDWLDLGITIKVEGQRVPFVNVFRALTAGKSSVLMTSGAYFSLQKPELRALRALIEEAQALQDIPNDNLRISRYQVSLFEELENLGLVENQAAGWQQQLTALRCVGTTDAAELPATIAASLRPYQLEGFRWLAFLWEFGLGGILADDMGLGKTLQTLALIAHAKEKQDPGPFLIVAPTSVVSNWPAEAGRFAPSLKVVTVADTLRRRGQSLDEVIGDADVVVTSYTLLRLDIDAYADRSWAGLILDEAQVTKNHQSKVYQCCRRLPAPFKLAITGTPMENNLMELWSLLSITSPGLFPSPSHFDRYYVRPIEKEADAERLAQLRRRIKPLVKRRTKEQVAADLPAKQEQVLEVELHPRHRKIYQTHLQRERQKVLGLVADFDKNRFTIFRSLTLLRQLSLHAGLVDEAHRELASAKIDALLEQLPDIIGSGHRALVFSQFTGFLDLIRQRLDAEGIEYCYLDGSTSNRPAVLKKFKEGSAPLFLISLKAGGVGLNLTEADYCFLLDPWWNPATEAQAVDRIHRIGQHKSVMVYRLIAKDTIEQKVMELKERKAALFAGVMDEGNAFGTGLSPDDIRGLFS
ncbi:SNF2-related protein [Kribbella sp. NPDC051620]|uniref:DEAD/DEAH box helicase n=1 Tax=Kribbella sp. NPDC051620 TaxID=3364120 RepID=UPI0037A05C95